MSLFRYEENKYTKRTSLSTKGSSDQMGRVELWAGGAEG